ncbi:Glycine cleavage system transcriptional repressor [Vibrio stylophorae]|uniref:Glycine cleavage system transcriptional repressor n=1 Tax=Vibrio stylophorae TaxID=659351 RepID=A0ABN8DWC7_9VIBR|nr:ACT domain-containing protein [Vibrio stylophorae]CAH0534178.1 Glycine cleavage system transcriptional repressor [Vibrio stylophorae]
MEHYLVITAMGHDRPGISNIIMHHVTECGCNIIDSRIAQFGSEFTLIMLLSGNANAITQVETTLPEQSALHDLLTVMKRTQRHRPKQSVYRAEIRVQVDDTAGILDQYTYFLASRDIDIASLSAHTTEACDDEHLAQLHIHISANLPLSAKRADVEQDFSALCDDLLARGEIEFLDQPQKDIME